MKNGFAVLVPLLASLFVGNAAAADAPAMPPEPIFATVNGQTISQKDFHNAFANHLRQKYYHGQVPEGQLAVARQEVIDQLVNRILLLDEAKRQGLAADEKRIAESIAEYDARYATSQAWKERRDDLLPGLKLQLAEQDLLTRVETAARSLPEPTDGAVRDYYKAHPELFTEPDKLRLHTILLKVAPSAPEQQWEAAREEGKKIVARLRAGAAKFEDMAQLHSQDRSADLGGDMGYVHRGMIPAQAQALIDAQELGVVGDPIDVLEGVAIFRLDERLPAKQMPFDAVAARARDLLKREQSKQAWDAFIARLRGTASIIHARTAAATEAVKPAEAPAAPEQPAKALEK